MITDAKFANAVFGALVAIDQAAAINYLVDLGSSIEDAQINVFHEQQRQNATRDPAIKARLEQVLYLVRNGIPYEIADKLNEVALAAHVEIMKEMVSD